MAYDFKFGKYWLSELGATSAEEPPVEIAQRDITFISVPGKDGKDCIDNKRYDNVEFKRKIAFVGNGDFKAQEKEINLINHFAYLQGYQDFEDNFHPGLVTEAALRNFNDVQRTLRTLHTAELSFSRKPFWYLKSALNEMTLDMNALISDGVEIINPFPAAAKPLYRFNMNFNGTGETTTCRVSLSVTANYDGVYEERRISKSSVRITATHHFVVLDLEKQHATVQDENGDIYSYVDMDLPDPIGEGRAIIKIIYQSKTVGLSIIPRWRCL
ncbi:MAG: hypothetical protein UIH27_04625 [Ruminococcus sp.]|nr:hypothetical protein [Ruminococcus sp.]